MSPAPETRALLLTDVVDSTALGERLGDAASAELWEAHDRIARDLLPEWHGREIDKTDGMLLLFERAADAAAYALAYQRALAALQPPLQARAGLHVGPVMLRENPSSDVARGAKPLEVEGSAKATTARIMSAARGGQVLLSEAARAALGEAPLALQSHGHWRLKGLAEAFELFELFTDGQRALPAGRYGEGLARGLPGRPVAAAAQRAPQPAGRTRRLRRPRAQTCTSCRSDCTVARAGVGAGVGGSGKTRLALRFGVDLARRLSRWRLVLRPVAGARHRRHRSRRRAGPGRAAGAGDPVSQLGHAIAGRGALPGRAGQLRTGRAPRRSDARPLARPRAAGAFHRHHARSRSACAGEQVQALAPLPADDAAALFVKRRGRGTRGFAPNDEDAAAIAPLVRLLDGLPLAIELAAARVRVMPPRMLLQRMSERFELLAAGGGRVDRQATLRAVFDWSWELLSPSEKAALAQLSVFEGGFTLAAVEAVLDLDGFDDAPSALDALHSLVQKSFVQQVGDARFDLLVSVHEYAAEHLETEQRYPGSGPTAAAHAKVRHGRYYAGLDEAAATAQRCADQANFVAACRRACASGDAELAVGLLERAWSALQLRGPFVLGETLAAQLLGGCRVDALQAARVHGVAATALQYGGRDADAERHFNDQLHHARSAGSPLHEALALLGQGDAHAHAGRLDAARACYASATDVAQRVQDASLLCGLHNSLGNLCAGSAAQDAARTHYERALQLARSAGNRRQESGLLGNLGVLCGDQGRMDEAAAHHQAALAVAREIHNLRVAGTSLCNLGMLYQLLGRPMKPRTTWSRRSTWRARSATPRSSATCCATWASCSRAGVARRMRASTSRRRWRWRTPSATSGPKASSWVTWAGCRRAPRSTTPRCAASRPARRCCRDRPTASGWPCCCAAGPRPNGSPAGRSRRALCCSAPRTWPRRSAPRPRPRSGWRSRRCAGCSLRRRTKRERQFVLRTQGSIWRQPLTLTK